MSNKPRRATAEQIIAEKAKTCLCHTLSHIGPGTCPVDHGLIGGFQDWPDDAIRRSLLPRWRLVCDDAAPVWHDTPKVRRVNPRRIAVHYHGHCYIYQRVTP